MNIPIRTKRCYWQKHQLEALQKSLTSADQFKWSADEFLKNFKTACPDDRHGIGAILTRIRLMLSMGTVSVSESLIGELNNKVYQYVIASEDAAHPLRGCVFDALATTSIPTAAKAPHPAPKPKAPTTNAILNAWRDGVLTDNELVSKLRQETACP